MIRWGSHWQQLALLPSLELIWEVVSGHLWITICGAWLGWWVNLTIPPINLGPR